MHVPNIPSAGRLAPSRLKACLCLLALAAPSALLALPAFPGADGFGKDSTGGRGGSVYRVTTLADSGPGSLRDAVSAPNRTIVFDVSGVIQLASPLVMSSRLTIAGQTAPGGGITLYGNRTSFSGASNVIVRYLRFREGINGPSGTDAVGAASGNDMIFDHVSASWGRDETFSLSGPLQRITLQDCIIGQGLLVHSAGGLIQTDGGVSILRSLYIDNWMRNPKVKGVNDFRNNLVYNWGSGGGYIPAGDSAGQTYANLIANYFVGGPQSTDSPFKTGNLNYHLFHAGNLQDLDRDGSLNGTPVDDSSFPTLDLISAPHAHPAPSVQLDALQAHAHVLAQAGSSLWRDQPDRYMINEVLSHGVLGAHISSEEEVGGVGEVPTRAAPTDTDGDGMPDWWEQASGNNPLVADNNLDRNGDGYTELEDYINALAPTGVQHTGITGVIADTGLEAGDGITTDGHVVLRGYAPAGAEVEVHRADTGLLGTTLADATGLWSFDATAPGGGAPLAPGYHVFRAGTRIADGSLSFPGRAFVVQVDNTPAAVPVISSISTTSGLQLRGTAEPGAIVDVLLDGSLLGSTQADSWGAWSLAPAGIVLAPGAHSFTSVATDLAGNQGAPSVALIINPDLAAPTFSSIASDTGVSATDQITNDPTLVLNGQAPAGALVTILREDVGVIGTATANASGVWSLNTTGTTLPQGTYRFSAIAQLDGASSPASTPFVVFVDQTRPQLKSLRRLNPAKEATSASTLTFRIEWAEPVVGVDAGDWTLTLTGTTGTIASLTQVDAKTQDIVVTGVSGDGTVRVDRKASGTGISDLAGNTVSGAYTGGQSYSIRLPGSGVWSSDENGAAWSNAGNWEDGLVPSGAGVTADFAQRDLSGALTLQLDGARTVGRVVAGDLDTDSPGALTLTDAGNTSASLTLEGPTPTIQVNAASTSSGDTADVPAANALPFTLDAVLAGTGGLTKTGVGTLALRRPATLSGPLTITRGIVEVAEGGELRPSAISIATSQRLYVSGGLLSTTGDITWKSGTGTGLWVTGGRAEVGRIIPSNARNSWVRVSGGELIANDISFLRSGDSEVQAVAAGVLIDGGDTRVGSMGLGTGDSWGAMSISGGRITVTGPLQVGAQKTAGRGGVITMTGGELNCTDGSLTGGLILARNPGGSSANTNNVAKLNLNGGTANVQRLTLGYDASSSAGSATVTLNGGTLRLGAGGLAKRGSGSFAANVNLLSGSLGALENWETSLPLTLAGAADAAVLPAIDCPADITITLSGNLIGTGGFEKRGEGTLVLAGELAFGGALRVAGGQIHLARPGTAQLPGGVSIADGESLRLRIEVPTDVAHGQILSVAQLPTDGLDLSRIELSGAPAGMALVPVLIEGGLGARVVETPVLTLPGELLGSYGTPLTLAPAASHDPKHWSAEGLPAGLIIDPATGVISGSPGTAGEFTVSITAENEAGKDTEQLRVVLTITALVRHAPVLNGSIDGSLQVVTAESPILNGNAWISGDLLLPGTPGLVLNGHPSFGGTIDGSGEAAPVGHSLTLNGNSLLGHLVTKVDPVALTAVSAPSAPQGNRSVHLNRASDTLGDPATLRDLTLNSANASATLPAGSYGSLMLNGGVLVLGAADATEPSVYELQSLTLNGNARLVLAGPVVLRCAGNLNLNSGSALQGTGALLIELAQGGLTVNNGTLTAIVLAPSGTITLNGNAVLIGRVEADRLVLNGQSQVR